ncbi:hypothetical protein NC652_003038 [Populus alba x Populus x berolinensis]|nr:hypothetical protein NC652_003038 [Populus alba x Populus x berolinensis]
MDPMTWPVPVRTTTSLNIPFLSFHKKGTGV